jgi:hypothetical protein
MLMSAERDRLRRVRRLRTKWRTGQPETNTEGESGTDEVTELRSEALDSNDRIRAEAPDDLETRRRADQLEREIKRPDRTRNP